VPVAKIFPLPWQRVTITISSPDAALDRAIWRLLGR